MLNRALLAGGCIVFVCVGFAYAANPTLDSALRVKMADGTLADAAKECGSGDLCGSLSLPSGDSFKIYSEGSGAHEVGSGCQPYKLHIVRMHGDSVLLSYDEETKMVSKNSDWQLHWNANNCRFRDTFIMLDEGQVKMGVFQNSDGDLSVRFADMDPSPSPSPST